MIFTELDTPSSLEHIRRIAAEVWPETFREILSREQIRYMMEMMYSPEVMEKELQDGFSFILLQIDGCDAGYISWSSCPEAADTAKIHKLYLLSRWHGCGIGTAMLEYMKKVSRKAGFAKLKLNVNKNNHKAIKAYRRNGFIITESVCNDIGSGYVMDDYVMTAMLT